MPTAYKCQYCNKTTSAGRFGRRKEAGGGGWSQGHTRPGWMCYSCVPKGGAKGEEVQAVVDVKAVKVEPVEQPDEIDVETRKVDVIATKRDGLALVETVSPTVDALEVTDAASYQQADVILGRIHHARKQWDDRMEPIIRPIRQGLDELYKLKRDIDKPLEELEKAVKDKMKAFKLEEMRQLRAAEEEAARLREQARQKEEAEARAKTEAMKAKIAKAKEELELKASQVQAAAVPVRGASSSSRPSKAWRCRDMVKVLEGILEETIPESMVVLNVPAINKYFKDNPAEVESWPGFEVVDDVTIVGR